MDEELTDVELLESISRKSRMMQALASQQGQLMREARRRGIDEDTVLACQRITNERRSKERRKARRAASRR